MAHIAEHYTAYHPRWLRPHVSTYWWLRKRSYFAFILREISSVFGHLYSAGGNLAECFVSARIAARHIASECLDVRERDWAAAE